MAIYSDKIDIYIPMFKEEKMKEYEQVFKKNNIKFDTEEDFKSLLNQMYQYAKIVYEQFKINNRKNLNYGF